MSPRKSPEKKKTQQSNLFSFYKPKRRRGRPKNSNKRDETRGRPGTASTSTKEPPSVIVAVARPPKSDGKQKRTNWSKGDHCIRLAQAVADWDGKTDATKDRPRLFGNEETNLGQTLPLLPQAAQEQAKTDLERPVGSAVTGTI